MADDELGAPRPDPALRRLDFLVGRWEMTGGTEEGPRGPAGETVGVETFEWLEGGFFLVHHWTASMEVAGEKLVDTGYEFFDFDPRGQRYRTRLFSSFGPYDDVLSTYVGGFDGDCLVLTGPARFTRAPNLDGTILVDADLPGPDGWVPFLHATLTRLA